MKTDRFRHDAGNALYPRHAKIAEV